MLLLSSTYSVYTPGRKYLCSVLFVEASSDSRASFGWKIKHTSKYFAMYRSTYCWIFSPLFTDNFAKLVFQNSFTSTKSYPNLFVTPALLFLFFPHFLCCFTSNEKPHQLGNLSTMQLFNKFPIFKPMYSTSSNFRNGNKLLSFNLVSGEYEG